VFALATVRDVLGERLRQPKRIRLSGGLTRAPLVRRLVADVFGCEVVRCEPDEASAFGAAMMAGIAVGVVPGEAAVAGRLRTIDVEQPDAGRVEKYAQIYGRYRACVDAILPLFNSQ
jgi:sugar (pentulose or hexulose) kinase